VPVGTEVGHERWKWMEHALRKPEDNIAKKTLKGNSTEKCSERPGEESETGTSKGVAEHGRRSSYFPGIDWNGIDCWWPIPSNRVKRAMVIMMTLFEIFSSI